MKHLSRKTKTNKQTKKPRICETGTREIAQWLSALAALKEDLGSVLSIQMVDSNCNSSSRESSNFFWPPWTPDMHMVPDIHADKHSHM